MDKNAIKKYAVWARTELITRVSQRAEKYDITAEADASASSVNGVLLSDAEIKQRKALIEQVKQKGFDQVMEEVAYTWFNRFIALRFMEVNGYLPSHIRVFTDDNNNFKPQILAEAIHLELDGLDMDKVYEMKNNNENDELYKYLIITQCNELSKILPGMFQKIADYTELLFPDNILREGSVIEQLVLIIPQDNWEVSKDDDDEHGQVQILGWLYQYYNIETFDSIFDGDMSRNKVTKELIPAATEIFTPDWVVKYMVENSLGRLWLESHPNSSAKEQWKYYLDNLEQESDIEKKLADIRKEYENITPEKIRCIDPCSGSGHICAYLFDVLMDIYDDYGIQPSSAVRSILENNLWGLDIDNRAAQLANFSIMMKAVQYDRRFLRRKDENGNPDIPQPHIYSIQESNDVPDYLVSYYANGNRAIQNALETIIRVFKDAKEYGSLIDVPNIDFEIMYQRYAEIEKDISIYKDAVETQIYPLIKVAEALSQKYHTVVTNPPYLGNSRMNAKLGDYIKKYYPDEKADLAMAMLNKVIWKFTKKNFFSAAITTVSWMYLKSFDKFRLKVINDADFICITDFGTELFEGKIGHLPVAAWVNRNSTVNQLIPTIRLVDYCYSRRDEKKTEYFNLRNRHHVKQTDFLKIPGYPIAYWASDKKIEAFEKGTLIDDVSSVKIGMGTGKNAVFVRNWWEVPMGEIDFDVDGIENIDESFGTFFPYNKGGDYRRWYGDLQEVVWYNKAGREKMFSMSGHRENGGKDGYFKRGITWNFIGTSKFAVRMLPPGCLFDVAGSALFVEKGDFNYILGFLSSTACNEILKLLNPTVNYQAGNIKSLPLLYGKTEEVDRIVEQNISICKEDWNSFETAWGFLKHPFINTLHSSNNGEREAKIEDIFKAWNERSCEMFDRLKKNEIELNRIFVETYGFDNEVIPDVMDKDISVRQAELGRDIKSFISYAVGCIFGRFSLDDEGIVFAGGNFDTNRYKTFPADKDGIIPICDDEYFDDDITELFIEFVKTVFGKTYLEENLQFIAHALDGNGNAREVIRNYFMNDFYNDHLKTYKKTPIYWLFDSGKKNGFKCLIYIHRYQPDTIARIRTDYVHEQQSRYMTAIEETENRLLSASGSDKIKLSKKLKHLKEQDTEIHEYEEKIHHLADQMISIDLDDGVLKNYAIFKDVLKKI